MVRRSAHGLHRSAHRSLIPGGIAAANVKRGSRRHAGLPRSSFPPNRAHAAPTAHARLHRSATEPSGKRPQHRRSAPEKTGDWRTAQSPEKKLRPVSRLVGYRLVGWSVGWLVGRSVGWLVGRLVGRSVNRSTGQPIGSSGYSSNRAPAMIDKRRSSVGRACVDPPAYPFAGRPV